MWSPVCRSSALLDIEACKGEMMYYMEVHYCRRYMHMFTAYKMHVSMLVTWHTRIYMNTGSQSPCLRALISCFSGRSITERNWKSEKNPPTEVCKYWRCIVEMHAMYSANAFLSQQSSVFLNSSIFARWIVQTPGHIGRLINARIQRRKQFHYTTTASLILCAFHG